MATDTALPTNRQRIEDGSRRRNEPQWLVSSRLAALEQAGQLALPKLEKTRIDRWNINHYGEAVEAPKYTSANQLPEQLKAYVHADDLENVLMQHNSTVVFEQLAEAYKEAGVIFTDMQTAVREHGELVQKYLMQAVKSDENQLTALHTALWSGGVFLYVPKNVQVEVPLQALFVTDQAEASFSPHVIVVAEDNSSVTYVDHAVLAGDSSSNLVHSGIFEVFVKPGARVQFASVHHLGEKMTDISYRRAVVENDGKMEWIIGEMNDGNCMSDTSSLLKGSGSVSDTKLICIGANEQKLNITTNARHWGKSSDSDMISRAVMTDSATAIINGITKIEHGATNSNGEQTERVLMLSPKARGDANPMLLIDEDEVTAGHAASVGQVDQEQIYYLMSRGVSRKDAERLIIYGFLAPVVNSIPIKKVSDQLQALIERKLRK